MDGRPAWAGRYLKTAYLGAIHLFALIGAVLLIELHDPIMDKWIRYHWSTKRYDEEQRACVILNMKKDGIIEALAGENRACRDSLKKAELGYRAVQAKFDGTFGVSFADKENVSLDLRYDNEYSIRKNNRDIGRIRIIDKDARIAEGVVFPAGFAPVKIAGDSLLSKILSSQIFDVSSADGPDATSWQEAVKTLHWKNDYGYLVHEIQAAYRRLEYAGGKISAPNGVRAKYYAVLTHPGDDWFLFVFPEYGKAEDLGRIVAGMKVERIRRNSTARPSP